MKKGLLGLLLVAFLLGGFLLPSIPIMAMTGTGSASNPFIISTVTDLQNVSNNLTAYYELASDIDASTTSTWNAGAGFDPIGTYDGSHPEYAFSGGFDGKEYVISDLYVDRPTEDYVGLFGYTATTCKYIRNVGLTGSDITGQWYVGILVGFHEYNSGKISDCYSTGDIQGEGSTGGLLGYNGAAVEDCYSTVTCAFLEAGYVVLQNGGLIGLNDGTVTRCRSTGDITVTGATGKDITEIGGLIGYHNNGTLTESYSTGDITVIAHATGDATYSIGGLVGDNTASITDCYARGSVIVTAGTGTSEGVGGLAGYNYGTIENCYSTGTITTTGMSYVGGLMGRTVGGTDEDCFWDTTTSGQATSDGGTGLTTSEMKTKTTYTNAGWDLTNVWKMGGAKSGGWAAFWLSSIAFLLFAGIMFGATKNPGLSILMAFPLVAVAAWLGVGTTMLQVVLIVVLGVAVIFGIYFILGRFA